MKNSSDTIGNRSRDIPVCSAVPQPLRHSVPHICTYKTLRDPEANTHIFSVYITKLFTYGIRSRLLFFALFGRQKRYIFQRGEKDLKISQNLRPVTLLSRVKLFGWPEGRGIWKVFILICRHQFYDTQTCSAFALSTVELYSPRLYSYGRCVSEWHRRRTPNV
jgi:hypothetical protein